MQEAQYSFTYCFTKINKYHLVLDCYFNGEIINKLVNFMDKNLDIGLIMPKSESDGSIQMLPNSFQDQLIYLLVVALRYLVSNLSNQPYHGYKYT